MVNVMVTDLYLQKNSLFLINRLSLIIFFTEATGGACVAERQIRRLQLQIDDTSAAYS